MEQDNKNSATVEGVERIGDSFTITLSSPFERQMKDGDVVFSRPGFTMYVANFWSDEGSRSARVERLKEEVPGDDVVVESTPHVDRLYRFSEPGQVGRQPTFYGAVVADDGHLQVAMYYNDERDAELAHTLWQSIQSTRQRS